MYVIPSSPVTQNLRSSNPCGDHQTQNPCGDLVVNTCVSTRLPEMKPEQLTRLMQWLSQRRSAGTWLATPIPGSCVVMTLPDHEIMVEMRLVEPWNP
jgi:hypothetical protein